IVDVVTKTALFKTESGLLSTTVRDILPNALPSRTKRIRRDEKVIIQTPISAKQPLLLILTSDTFSAEILSNLILYHITSTLGIVIEVFVSKYKEKRLLGAEILSKLINKELTNDSASILLQNHDLEEKPLCIVTGRTQIEKLNLSWLYIQLINNKIPNLISLKKDTFLILAPYLPKVPDKLCAFLPEKINLGVSDPIELSSNI